MNGAGLEIFLWSTWFVCLSCFLRIYVSFWTFKRDILLVWPFFCTASCILKRKVLSFLCLCCLELLNTLLYHRSPWGHFSVGSYQNNHSFLLVHSTRWNFQEWTFIWWTLPLFFHTSHKPSHVKQMEGSWCLCLFFFFIKTKELVASHSSYCI